MLLRQAHQPASQTWRIPISRGARNRHRALHRRDQRRPQTLPVDRTPKPHPRGCQTWEANVRVDPLEGVVKTAAVPQWLRHGGDDAWSDERAADPLHCPWIDSEPFGNDAHTGPPRSRQGLTNSLFKRGGNWGAPEPLTFTPGPRKPGTDSFRNHRPLKFGEHA